MSPLRRGGLDRHAKPASAGASPQPEPLKLLLISTSPLAVSRLGRAIGELPALRLLGTAADFSSAYVLAEREEPDIAIIGHELMRHPDLEGLISLFRATGTAVIEAGEESAARPDILPVGKRGDELLTRLRQARQQVARPLAPLPRSTAPPPQMARPSGFQPGRMILIGSSTGGIDALLTILSAFPADCPPTAIVQHTGAAFSASLIRLLDRCCPARVVQAAPGLAMMPGQVILGAGLPRHFQLAPGNPHTAQLVDGPPISGHQPSLDARFLSALPLAWQTNAALLTGMVRDGAQGLLDLRRAGARTVAQDEASSVVYGMPRAAVELGAADEVLPLGRIGQTLLGFCTAGRSTPVAK